MRSFGGRGGYPSVVLPGPDKSYTGELRETGQRGLRGAEAEAKIFFSIVLVIVCRLMMVGI